MSYLNDHSSSHSNELESELLNLNLDNGRKRSLREKTRQAQAAARVQKLKDDFLNDFDPEKSKREKRKLKRKVTTQANRNSVYDEKGRLRESLIDICDCLHDNCGGCFFPCPNCKSSKCGPTCRVNRKFAYDLIEFDGNNDVIRNDYIFTKK